MFCKCGKSLYINADNALARAFSDDLVNGDIAVGYGVLVFGIKPRNKIERCVYRKEKRTCRYNDKIKINSNIKKKNAERRKNIGKILKDRLERELVNIDKDISLFEEAKNG